MKLKQKHVKDWVSKCNKHVFLPKQSSHLWRRWVSIIGSALMCPSRPCQCFKKTSSLAYAFFESLDRFHHRISRKSVQFPEISRNEGLVFHILRRSWGTALAPWPPFTSKPIPNPQQTSSPSAKQEDERLIYGCSRGRRRTSAELEKGTMPSIFLTSYEMFCLF